MLIASLPPSGPITYSLIWFIIGLCLLFMIIGWYVGVFIYTRKKAPKTFDALSPAPIAVTLDDLKQKYLKIIAEYHSSYLDHRLTLRELHKGLSLATRQFVYEASLFPAPRLTLSDFKRASFPHLTQLIEMYYDKEFAEIEHGDPMVATEAAKRLVSQWG